MNNLFRRLFNPTFNSLDLSRSISYLTRDMAMALDDYLLSEGGFSVDQLMELAGLSCAQAIFKSYTRDYFKDVLIVCGPGNNGGDGLVTARHLKQYGYYPIVFYPTLHQSIQKNGLYRRLLVQLNDFNVPVIVSQPENIDHFLMKYNLIVDALFGFGFNGNLSETFRSIIMAMTRYQNPIFSIDIPSGWTVDGEPNIQSHMQPHALISLSAPKSCSAYFTGKWHWLGGRFVCEKVKELFKIDIPKYNGTDQCVLISQSY